MTDKMVGIGLCIAVFILIGIVIGLLIFIEKLSKWYKELLKDYAELQMYCNPESFWEKEKDEKTAGDIMLFNSVSDK